MGYRCIINRMSVDSTTISPLMHLKLRLTSPILGGIKDHRGIMTLPLETTTDGITWFIPPQEQWHWALREGLRLSGKDADSADYISLPRRIKAPTIRPFYRAKSKLEKFRKIEYQSFQKGSIVQFDVAVLSEINPEDVDPNIPSPPLIEQNDVIKTFEIIGDLIGLSPWGNRYGFGRFTID